LIPAWAGSSAAQLEQMLLGHLWDCLLAEMTKGGQLAEQLDEMLMGRQKQAEMSRGCPWDHLLV
jgi:hypothetical protein